MDQAHKTPKPSKRHQPPGLPILHEDRDIIVVEKPSGLLTIGTDREKTKTAHYLLNEYVRKGNSKSQNRVYVVHRLDRETSGILLFAKSEQAKRFLQDNWDQADKRYLAIVHGLLTQKEGTITTYLAETSALKVYSTPNTAKGKLAQTAYQVLQERNGFSLVEVHLITGRKHQIRVHFAEMGHPVLGDKKYGNDKPISKRLALFARSLSFIHPFNGRQMNFDLGMPADFMRLFSAL